MIDADQIYAAIERALLTEVCYDLAAHFQEYEEATLDVHLFKTEDEDGEEDIGLEVRIY
jgi:hypothetical protein